MKRSSIGRAAKLAMAILVAGAGWLAASRGTTAQQGGNGKPAPAGREFEFRVREDFFAGLAGDGARFDRAMKACEEALAKNPKHPEALVWHGAGLYTQGGFAFQKGDMRKGGELWQRGLDEMAQAVSLEPENIAVLIPRAAVLLVGSRFIPMPALAAEQLRTAVNDYEKTLKLQTERGLFPRLSTHARGELLAALAEGWARLGDEGRARGYFDRLAKEMPDTGYATFAQGWLQNKTLPKNRSCSGCHAQ